MKYKCETSPLPDCSALNGTRFNTANYVKNKVKKRENTTHTFSQIPLYERLPSS